MPVGLYISVPFCKTKCSYCNFASDVFSRAVFERYVAGVCADIEQAAQTADQMGGSLDRAADTIYFGGGTPTLLDVTQLERIFVTIRQNFSVPAAAEITVECAPGTLTSSGLEALQRCGVNRVSLGVQSFDDHESASVGRVHKRSMVIEDVAALRSARISNLNVDLIAGLPHQTRESWEASLEQLISLRVPHASIYMLEVDEDSRLGREVIAGGQKYHAHFVADEDLTADMYEVACEKLNAAGIRQYEISNFANTGFESRHNMKYWTRQPYLGFGVDAHSMLHSAVAGSAVRFSNSDSLEKYCAGGVQQRTFVSSEDALEEALFLGLRLNKGIDLGTLRLDFGENEVAAYNEAISELIGSGLLESDAATIRLTPKGRLLSNEVFERFISVDLAVIRR
ncbi:MAG TPA: radical SAM family heme chaperone HemW [Terriglobales bacterium]|jgi:oxygen-independent coproporphyrinogen-3 oxidase|nr:radical SAM family heme chaperone HemW [Terriglobales bacterium]